MSSLFALALLTLVRSATSSMDARAETIEFLEDRFEIPAGFRVYRVADGSLAGGSYDLAFDGDGRLLVGDGTRVRRLEDTDGDAVYDRFSVIAEGLGGRGPQGLVVDGDRLIAVGGDGVQMFTGYRSGEIQHASRIGAPFHTGGDHAAHTIFRGHDDYFYFITGDGGGARDRDHITVETSPALFERAGSVFRIDPTGENWECIGTGGRNAPNLGMDELGDLFSLDSDMEWHVDLPWWRPVRLNHWLTGGDQGWQSVGAYPPYFVDALPGILDVGRGSPDWGQFYEHERFPAKYRGAYFVCDYRSKSATSGGYDTTGRLYAFFIERDGPGYRVEQEVFAIPRSGAVDDRGERIDFALVDIEVGPDGDLYLSDHSRGVWRVYFDPEGAGDPPPLPGSKPASLPVAFDLDALLALPQPGAEWSRVRRDAFRRAAGDAYGSSLERVVLDSSESLARRLRALRYLAPLFAELSTEFVARLARTNAPELRGQAAWLAGIRRRPSETQLLVDGLRRDADPFVRRRALEALTRRRLTNAELLRVAASLEDPHRTIRYAATLVLSHHPIEAWFDELDARPGVQTRVRALVAASLRRDRPEPPRTRATIRRLIADVRDEENSSEQIVENRLDVLRTIGLYAGEVRADEALVDEVERFLLEQFAAGGARIRWETARLIGQLDVHTGFAPLSAALEREGDRVAQFHFAQCLARLSGGWAPETEARAVAWFLAAQSGWFTEFAGKGRQFPGFWSTVLTAFVEHHATALAQAIDRVDLSGRLGRALLDRMAEDEGAAEQLAALLRSTEQAESRRRIAEAFRRQKGELASEILRDAIDRERNDEVRRALTRSLCEQPPRPRNRPYLEDALLETDDETVRAAAIALTRFRPSVEQDVVQAAISRMVERSELVRACEKFLVAMTGEKRDGYESNAEVRRRASDAERTAALEFWRLWYARQFGEPFRPVTDEAIVEKSNEEVRRFLLGEEVRGGDPRRGAAIYEALCVKCHGGSNKGRTVAAIFGPDLAGVTRRLNPTEFADGLVDPSKVVADRYRAVIVQLEDGRTLTGFVTEETEKRLSLATQERVERIASAEIEVVMPQETSLMPDGLLNRLEWGEIRNLVAYIEALGAKPAPGVEKTE